MDGDEFFCEVCGAECDIEESYKGACPECGREHHHDEGVRTFLSEEDRRVLREHDAAKKGYAAPTLMLRSEGATVLAVGDAPFTAPFDPSRREKTLAEGEAGSILISNGVGLLNF